MSQAEKPFVTVAIPCLNEEGFIEECIRGVQAQDYPADRLEIIVADGGSGDRTLEILARLAVEDPRILVLHNPGRIQAAGLNVAVRRSRGDVIVRMDVHADYAKNYISKSVEVLERTGADNVGGAARTRSRGFFQRALCSALTSKLAFGGSAYRDPSNEGWVESVFNGAFRRRVFEEVGLYDEGAVTNEDAELNQRLISSGGRVYLSRDIETWYYPRDSMGGLMRQYFKYGRGRARTLLKHGKFLSLRPAVPFLMVLGGAGLLAISPLQPLALLPFAAYGALTFVEAARAGWRDGPASVAVIWAIFPVLHTAHGLGFGSGLVHYRRKPDWRRDGDEKLPARADAPAPPLSAPGRP